MLWFFGFFFYQEVPAIYPTFQLGFSEAQRGRTCLSFYSESTAQQGIRAHNPAGICLGSNHWTMQPHFVPGTLCWYVVCQEKSLSVANKGGTL